ncbi:hypothetical protein HPB51_000638 [Rhipicephalus microplus]|uniref:Uncharacterized protein n=1 Tax=Rhipicephalus microplus TaxID=6941 RepID=A0A9J6DEE1_RHIMP|nr:hypothetical protein HPB51_000638 [Rhipicephalus microplus]
MDGWGDKELPVDQFLRNGVASVPVALVPSNDGVIKMKNPKVIQSELKAATTHYHTITEVRQFGKGGIVCFSPDQLCVKDLLKCSMFATNPDTSRFHGQSPIVGMCQCEGATTTTTTARWHVMSLEDLESSDDPVSESEDSDSSSRSSSVEQVERLYYMHDDSDDKRCVQAAVIVTFVSCLSIVLLLIFLDSVDARLPQNSTYRHHANSSFRTIVRPRYSPGERPEKFIICTLGGNAVERRMYPPNGLCNWIIYTHVGYDAQNRSLAPTGSGNWLSWAYFLQLKSYYVTTRLAPSLDWKNLTGLQKQQARELNQTLSALRMAGLAMLNVHIGVHEVAVLAQLFATLASANPGMFLALGASFERLNDQTAPSACADNVAGPPEHGYGEHGSHRLTFRGARLFMAQPALRYANPAVLARCLSIAVGALVFHLPPGERPQLGARCTHWSLERLETVCRLASVRANVHAHAMYGQTQRTFFSYESAVDIWSKVFPTLQSMVWDELPTCLAVYALDLDSFPGQCLMEQERPNRLIFVVYDVIKLLKSDSASESRNDSIVIA